MNKLSQKELLGSLLSDQSVTLRVWDNESRCNVTVKGVVVAVDRRDCQLKLNGFDVTLWGDTGGEFTTFVETF